MAAGGRPDFVARVLSLYRENAPPAIDALATAAQAGDWEAAARAAHALKSMSLNIGAEALAEAAGAIERAGRGESGRAGSGRVEAADVEALRALYARSSACLTACLAAGGPAAASPSPPDDADLALLADLRAALEADGLDLAYQPIVDRTGRTVVGAEALARWRHPQLGPIAPSRFVPLAERNGLSAALGAWVMRRALRETADWPIRVSVNMSALHIRQPGFLDDVGRWLREAGCEPGKLTIEVTETAFMGDDGEGERILQALRRLGVRLALDDFGAGYSSLLYLRRFPFDAIKIDRDFVADLGERSDASAIIHAVVAIGRALGKEVIAEGVETPEQHAFLRAAGVNGLQGYLFGRPIAPAAFAALLGGPQPGVGQPGI